MHAFVCWWDRLHAALWDLKFEKYPTSPEAGLPLLLFFVLLTHSGFFCQCFGLSDPESLSSSLSSIGMCCLPRQPFDRFCCCRCRWYSWRKYTVILRFEKRELPTTLKACLHVPTPSPIPSLSQSGLYCAKSDGPSDEQNGFHTHSARQTARHHWHNYKTWRWWGRDGVGTCKQTLAQIVKPKRKRFKTRNHSSDLVTCDVHLLNNNHTRVGWPSSALRRYATIKFKWLEFHNAFIFYCLPHKQTVDGLSSAITKVFFDILPQIWLAKIQ